MAPFALVCDDVTLQVMATTLARRWGFAMKPLPESGLYLALTREGLALSDADQPKLSGVRVAFAEGAVAHRHRFGGGRGQTIAKAVGLNKGKSPTVIDATAGLGRDAFVLASLGATVTLIERSPVVAALLEDGIARSAYSADAAPVVARMQLLSGDALELLESVSADVVYLDPMFPKRNKTAQVKKEMALLQRLHGGAADDQQQLLVKALGCARERVVVKRPTAAEPLPGPAPTMAINGKKHRFDVYVIKAMRG